MKAPLAPVAAMLLAPLAALNAANVSEQSRPNAILIMRHRSQPFVLYVAYNGEPTEALTSGNAPLRGGKGDLREGGIRVPTVVSGEKHIPAGSAGRADRIRNSDRYQDED